MKAAESCGAPKAVPMRIKGNQQEVEILAGLTLFSLDASRQQAAQMRKLAQDAANVALGEQFAQLLPSTTRWPIAPKSGPPTKQ